RKDARRGWDQRWCGPDSRANRSHDESSVHGRWNRPVTMAGPTERLSASGGSRAMAGERREASPMILVGPGEQVQDQPPSPPTLKETTRLVSVVVPCCGQLEYTRLCVPSLLRHSRRPCELIFVDIGSLDGTPEYLAGVADAAPVRIE